MRKINPLQLSFNNQVLEQNRKFYFTASATLGVNLQTGEELLDLNYFKDVFECMGENPLPDMGMPKPNGEFLVSGNYFAPGNKAVSGGEVKVRLDKTEKNLYVFGKRKWIAGLPSKPEEITSMHLDYTKAYGGNGFEKNPDGIGYRDGLLPCIENPKNLVASTGDKPDPAGFSPLYPMLPQRMKYQGTYDSDYKKKYFPGYPEDHDWKYFLCAPFDQWTKGFYKGNENFSIFNMHPEIPVIKGRFPGLYARCFINQKKKGEEVFGELPLNLDTIWLFPEKLLGLLIFRGVTEVEDDEAENITHVLCAYEDNSQESRPLEYYKSAFEKRKNSDDDLLTNLNTQDLIPDGHKCAMELLMETALSSDDVSEFAKNIDEKAETIQKMADEKIEETIQNAEKNLSNVDIPDDAWEHLSDDAKKNMPGKEGGLDIRKIMGQKAKSDPDVEKFNTKLESIMPGITAGDPKQLEMKDFSFDKIDEIMEAVDGFVDKKEKEIENIALKEIEKTKVTIKKQIDTIDRQIDQAKEKIGSKDSDRIKTLEEEKEKINESMKALDDIDLERTETKVPLPRINAEEIIEQMGQIETQIDPIIMEAMQHVQSMKAMGAEDEKTKDLEKEIQKQIEASKKQMADSFKQAEDAVKEGVKSFKEGYIMAAHFMGEGLSPHKESLEEVKKCFLDAVSKGEDVSEGDFACIDLAGVNLDGIDLSRAFLEQVNFKGASLKGANLTEAILARAELEGADLTGANFEKANVGAVHALRANFTDANMKSAKLSKGDFTEANFSKANLEDIESLEIIIDCTDFTQAHMPNVVFLEIKISGTKFINTDINTSAFINCSIEDCDFSKGIMNKCTFVDTKLSNVCFDKAVLENACFVATGPEKSCMEKLKFRGACLNQVNFQNMDMKKTDFAHATMENAFFGGTDLSESDLSNVQAKNAQFRKAKLTRAKLNKINLDQGSFAKANLVGASFKGANLHAVDFLRSTITNTDFSGSNLDATLIEHWRPK